MNKKLIITEQQYKNLKFFLLESTFDEMAKKVIKKGDTITITTQGKKFNFEVVDNNSGLILMDVSDKNSDYFGRRAFLSFTSFNDNKLELNLASEKQKEEQPPQVKTWAKWTLKDVDQIDVFRGGKMVDGTNFDPNGEENTKRKQRFIEAISTLGDGDRIIIETTGKLEEIYLDFIGKTSNTVQFELGEDTEDDLGNINISSIEISTDEKDIEVTKEGLLTIKITTYESKDGNMEKKESKIQNIRDFVITNDDDVESDEENKGEDGEEPVDPEKEPESSFDINKFKQFMQNDDEFKKAFLNYKGKLKPSAWASFANEFKKGSKSSSKDDGPKSSGFIKLNNILDTYEKGKLSRFGDNFKKRAKIRFVPLEEVSIPYPAKGGEVTFTLRSDKVYGNEMAVYYKGIDDSDLSEKEFNLKLANNSFELILKEKTDTPNVYICDVIKLYQVKEENEKGEEVVKTEKTAPQKDVNIRFINSDGYDSDENLKK